MNEQMRPEDKVRRALEGARAKLFLRFGEKKSKWIIRGSIIGICAIIVLTVAFLCIRIQSIDVEGDVTMFNEGEIIRAAEIAQGDGLLWRSSGAIRRSIEKNMPIAHNVKVTKSLLGKVTIYVELLPVEYYFEYNGSFYALDCDLLVLDKSDSHTKYTAYGAIKVLLPEIREPAIGDRIVFYDTVEETDTEGEPLYEVKEEKTYAYVQKFLSELSSSGYLSQTGGVDLREKFDITIRYADKFRVRFGDVTNLEIKYRMLYEIIEEGSMQYAERVRIDLSDPSEATARADATVDFSEFED